MFKPYIKHCLLALLLLSPGSLLAEVIQADNQSIKEFLAKGIPIIDVRTPPEWRQTGVIEGSILLTFFDESGRFDAAAWLRRLGEIVSPEQPVALICAVGGRTQAITHFLSTQAGYTQVHNITRGIKAWIEAGNPTVAPDSHTAPPPAR